jgi:hypothetical protein
MCTAGGRWRPFKRQPRAAMKSFTWKMSTASDAIAMQNVGLPTTRSSGICARPAWIVAAALMMRRAASR